MAESALRIGTRGSRLARVQAEMVARALAAAGTPYTVSVTSDIAIEHLTLNSAAATVELQSNTLWAQSGIALANGVLLLSGLDALNEGQKRLGWQRDRLAKLLG